MYNFIISAGSLASLLLLFLCTKANSRTFILSSIWLPYCSERFLVLQLMPVTLLTCFSSRSSIVSYSTLQPVWHKFHSDGALTLKSSSLKAIFSRVDKALVISLSETIFVNSRGQNPSGMKLASQTRCICGWRRRLEVAALDQD